MNAKRAVAESASPPPSSLYDELRSLTNLNDFADKNAVLQGAITLIEVKLPLWTVL
jgi:hypothetical protein